MTNVDVTKETLNKTVGELLAMGLTLDHLNTYKESQEKLAATKQAREEYLAKHRAPVKPDFRDITIEMENLYRRKNADYGNAFDRSLDEDGMLVPKIRLGDKYARFCKLIYSDPEVAEESLRDTLIDMANYAIMTILWLDGKKVGEYPAPVEEAITQYVTVNVGDQGLVDPETVKKIQNELRGITSVPIY